MMVEHLAVSRTRRRVSHSKSSSGVAPKGAKRVDGTSASADVDDEAARNLAAAETSVLGRCVAHDEDFKYVCNQCSVPVCVSCTVLIDGGHHAHGMISLDKVRIVDDVRLGHFFLIIFFRSILLSAWLAFAGSARGRQEHPLAFADWRASHRRTADVL